MADYEDSGKPCVDCGQGTYVKYHDGIKCRYCGEPQKKRVTATPTKGRINE